LARNYRLILTYRLAMLPERLAPPLLVRRIVRGRWILRRCFGRCLKTAGETQQQPTYNNGGSI
jgi:hypothetical protein